MPLFTNPRLRLPLLILVAIAARALTFGNPVVHVDEEFYYFTGTALWHGLLPFVDVWDRKPVGLFLLYAVPAGLGFPAGIWAYQAMALASLIATAALVARLATRAGFAAGATASALAYVLWFDLLGGQGGQSPVFYNLLMIGAALLALRGTQRAGLAAMALVGVALQIKYSVVFEGLFLGLWLLADDWRARKSPGDLIGYGIALVALAMLPTALAFSLDACSRAALAAPATSACTACAASAAFALHDSCAAFSSRAAAAAAACNSARFSASLSAATALTAAALLAAAASAA